MCKHQQSMVLDSRKADSLASDGKANFGPRSYPFLAQRRRKCLDCGVTFATVEVEKAFLDGLADRYTAQRETVLELIRTFLDHPDVITNFGGIAHE